MMPDILVISPTEVEFAGRRYRCAVGPNGFTGDPKEGDKATPIGRYPLRECWYRADRVEKPRTALPLRIIEKDDGWCDDPAHKEYNRHVKLPFPASHETLWREDHIYDIMIPVGFNDRPVTPGLGSAIMFHLARDDFSPTLGCVAVSRDDMLEMLAKVTAYTQIVIAPTRNLVAAVR